MAPESQSARHNVTLRGVFANHTKGVRFLDAKKKHAKEKQRKVFPFRDSLDTQSKSSVKRSGEGVSGKWFSGPVPRATRPTFFRFRAA